MRVTVSLDNGLFEEARELTGIVRPSDVVTAGLRALVQQESQKRLALLGGSDPKAKAPRRRRSRKQ